MSKLDRERYEPSVITGAGTGFIVDQIREMDVPIRFIRGRYGGGKAATLHAARQVRHDRPHILHSYALAANMWAAISRRFYPKAIHIAGVRGRTYPRGLQVFAERALFRSPDMTVCNSDFFRKYWIERGLPDGKVTVIHNGVAADRFAYPPNREQAKHRLGIDVSSTIVTMIGSFRALKRWDLFLNSVATLSGPVVALAVGEGGQRPEMEALAAELGITERVRFLGLRSDVPEILEATDILVSASDSEGLSNSILEAMCAGVPVVGSAVGGTPELIVDGVTGILFPPSDLSALTSGLQRLVASPSARLTMGDAARARAVNEFSVAACVRKTEEMYEQLLARMAKSGAGTRSYVR